MNRHLRRATVPGLLALVAFGLGWGGAASAAAVATLRYGIDDEQNINRLPQVIAEREGFFAREGLKVEIVPFTSSFRGPAAGPNAAPETIREGMAKGTIDMSRQQLPLLIWDVLMAGGKSVGVAVAANNPMYFVVARPEIKSYADLKGKTVTITGDHDGITIWTRKLLAVHGLKNEDVSLKDIAGSGGRLDCLKSGECAAASLAQPAVLGALDAGFHTLGVTNELAPLLYQVDVANPVWAAAHRDAVVKYIRATTAAMRFIEDPKNHEEVIKVTMALMGETQDRARRMLANIWDPKNRVFQKSGLDVNAVRETISLLGEYGVLKQPLPAPERFVDATYSKAAGQ